MTRQEFYSKLWKFRECAQFECYWRVHQDRDKADIDSRECEKIIGELMEWYDETTL